MICGSLFHRASNSVTLGMRFVTFFYLSTLTFHVLAFDCIIYLPNPDLGCSKVGCNIKQLVYTIGDFFPKGKLFVSDITLVSFLTP